MNITSATPPGQPDLGMGRQCPKGHPGDEAFAYETFWPGDEVCRRSAADVYRDDWNNPITTICSNWPATNRLR